MTEQGGRRRRRQLFDSEGSPGDHSPEFKAVLQRIQEGDTVQLEEPPAEDPAAEETADGGSYGWRQWAAENRLVVALASVVVALALYGAVSMVSGVLFSGAEQSSPGDSSQAAGGSGDSQPGGSGGEGSGVSDLAAQRVGSLEVTKDEDQVEVVFEKPSGETMEWSGELASEEGGSGEETPRLELSGPTAASFVSVLSESGRRSWLGFIKQTGASGEDYVVEATLSSDPGEAAVSGRTPVVRGSYVVKARDGSFSASGTFTDVLVSEREVERTYTEDYLSASGGSAPRERTIKVSYDIEGEAAMAPALFGWTPPSGEGPEQRAGQSTGGGS